MNLVATMFTWQPVCNATRAAHALHLDQLSLDTPNYSIVIYFYFTTRQSLLDMVAKDKNTSHQTVYSYQLPNVFHSALWQN